MEHTISTELTSEALDGARSTTEAATELTVRPTVREDIEAFLPHVREEDQRENIAANGMSVRESVTLVNYDNTVAQIGQEKVGAGITAQSRINQVQPGTQPSPLSLVAGLGANGLDAYKIYKSYQPVTPVATKPTVAAS